MGKVSTSERLKELMLARNLRQVDIINAAKPHCIRHNIKLGKNDLSQYVSGKVIPGQDKLTILGLALNVSEAWLMGYDVSPDRTNSKPSVPDNIITMPEMRKIPRIGRIACGDPITAEENIEDYDEAPVGWHADFSLVCVGDSMSPKIEDGDIVAIRSQQEVQNGEIAAVRIGDEATLKMVFLHSDYIELRPVNPEYPSKILIGEQMGDVQIEGKAVGLFREL